MSETHFFSRVSYGLPKSNFSEDNYKKMWNVLNRKSRIAVDQEPLYKLNSKKEVFEYVIGTFNHDDKNTFLEKTPRHVFFYSEILQYYPDAKFICMIREPKNVISSQLATTSKPNKSVIRLSLLYNKIANAIITISNQRNVVVVRYEDLTSDPERILKNTFKFLNMPYDSKLLDNVAAPPGIITPQAFWQNRNLEFKKIQKNNPDKWRKALTKGQANVVDFITGNTASQFGFMLEYDWIAVCKGFVQDMKRLSSPREFKKIFSKVHG
jgi:hypothetical protein